ncbi:hypothetical protein GPX89_10505 [Nocardia sp. ET3-3]|uniref:Low molecular weight antigen MTB12-like C-terminal domain-containing protein n=1 Tax=Nocardia terrae TaxID=2675851 RepID=A0A7K1UTK2_9NOCA|nr:hypothetical protein [Nocardia terrae]
MNKYQKIGRVAIASLAVVSALGLSACGSGDKPGAAKPSKTTTSKTVAAQSNNYPPVPTAADLNAKFQVGVDPNTPNEQKLEFFQGVSADPTLPQRLTDFYKQSNATVTVTNVTDLGNGTLTADAEFALSGGQPQKAVVPFVAEDGKWKVQKDWICQMLSLGNQTSPACS